jgi:hypothetical protein
MTGERPSGAARFSDDLLDLRQFTKVRALLTLRRKLIRRKMYRVFALLLTASRGENVSAQ